MSIAKWLLAKKLSGGGSPFPPVIKRATGNPIEFTDGADAPLVKCVTEIVGSQDLHGQDKPWVGGAGINTLSPAPVYSNTVNDVLITSDGNGNYTLNGLASATVSVDLTLDTSLSFPNSNVYLHLRNTSASGDVIVVLLADDNTQLINRGANNINQVSAATNKYGNTATKIRFYITSGTNVNMALSPMVLSTATIDKFYPYSNICPITAYDEGEIEVRGKNALNNADAEIGTAWNGGSNSARARLVVKKDPYTPYVISMNGTNGMDAIYVKRYSSVPASDAGTQITSFPVTIPATDDNTFLIFAFSKTAISQTDVDNLKLQVEKGTIPTTYEPYTSTTHTTTYPSAIFRGSEDVVNGTVEIEWGYIASYAGETLPGEWISDRDEYAPGTTPTTGAQVAYALATPTTSSVTPTNLPIKSLSGYNHIESSTGDMIIDYITDAYQNFVDTVESALPNTTRNLLSAGKGGTKAMDIFLSLEKRNDKEEEVKEETKDDMR